jgi:hypothetical protein
MAYDSARRLIVIVDGGTGQAWEYDGTGWTPRPFLTHPPAIEGAAIAYDGARGVVVLFGGQDSAGVVSQETWEYSGTGWITATPTASPPGRSYATMTYDTARGRVVMFGGLDTTQNTLDSTWEYDGTTWTERSIAGRPPDRGFASIAYDLLRHRVVMFSGFQMTQGIFITELADTCEYDGTSWTEVPLVDHPPVLQAFGFGGYPMAYDAARARVVVFDDGTWTLGFAPLVAPEACSSSVGYDRDSRVGCADEDCAGICTGCGDQVCTAAEDCRSCPADCTCASPVCGDYVCEPPETTMSCPGDC